MIVFIIIAIIILVITLMSSSTTDKTRTTLNTDRNAGITEETALPLGDILPLICSYDKLDEDIKYNLENNPNAKFVYNYRTMESPYGIPYSVIISTSKMGNNEYSCDYTLLGMTDERFMIFYNIYEFLEVEFFLRQIRVKENGKYIYKQSDEVKQKLPTFCKLINNAIKVDKEYTYGLPFISFLDAEQKMPLLATWIHVSDLKKEGDMDKFHIAMWKILSQLTDEMQKAGILNQSKKALVQNLVRIGLLYNRLTKILCF